MSAGDRDTLAAVLEGTRIVVNTKAIGYGFNEFGATIDAQTAAHLADVLLASDWLREQRAEAWDKCCDLHFREGDDPYAPIGSRCDRNPYRRTTEEHRKLPKRLG